MAKDIKRISPIASNTRLASPCEGAVLEVVEPNSFQVISAWPERFDEVLRQAATHVGVKMPAVHRFAVQGENGALLNIEPLKLALVNAPTFVILRKAGHSLDQSHAHMLLRLDGDGASEFLSCHIGLDLRPTSFPEETVASTAIHGIGILVWRRPGGFNLFIPRTFARAIWEDFTGSLALFERA